MYLSTAQACGRLGVGRATLAKLIKQGEISAIKGKARNSHIKIPEESVADYLKRQEIVPDLEMAAAGATTDP